VYILFILVLSGVKEVKTQEFETITSCMQAIEKVVNLEDKSFKVKAFCTKK
jgi:hypothetical protein